MRKRTGHRSSSRHLALIVNHPARTGGMETFCRFLVQTARAAGWRITIALSGENIYNAQPSGESDVIRIDPVNWLDATCAGDREYAWARIRERQQWFRRVKPDVAVFVQSSNTPFRAAIAGARLAGVPAISTHRTMAWPVETVPSRRHLFGLLPGLGLHGRRVIFKTWLTSFLANRIVYNSAQVRSGYETLYHYPKHRGLVIPNAVLAPPIAGAPATNGDRLTIGFAGRIASDKRIDVLLRAVAAMHARQARVVIYGQGAEQASLAALAAELGMANRVEWRGLVQNPTSAYADMDVVALCSPRESSSNMALEAMAAGKAVVVTNAGGMPELVDHGRCGLCVPTLDVGELASALDALAASAELRRQLGERARTKAMREHDPRIVGERWLALLDEVAGPAPLAASRMSTRWEHDANRSGHAMEMECL